MKRFVALTTLGMLALTPLLAADKASASLAWPDRDLARFVFEHLDLSSFRNSTGPRRKTGQRTFKDLNISPTRVTDTEAASDDDWLYSIQVLGKRERDGIQEVMICFRDIAQNGGSYSSVDHYVLRLIEGRAIALAFTEEAKAEASGCNRARGR